ncbi:MAG: hypothetical protein GY778_19170 [bacterium]|nr:hypothetical protein [bacterium]
MKFGSIDDVEDWQDSIVTIDEVVEITTDTGRQYTKCMIESAAPSQVTPAVRHDPTVTGPEVVGRVAIRGRMLPQ